MRAIVRILMTVLLLLASSLTHASVRYEIGGGLAVPLWPEGLRENWSFGPNLALGASFDAGHELEGALLMDVSTFGLEHKDDCRTGVLEGGRVTHLSITANVRTYATGMKGSTKPFLMAGGGYHSFGISELKDVCEGGSTRWPDSKEDGVAVVMYGGGLKFPVTRAIEALAQVYLMESWSTEHGTTSRTFVLRALLRPVRGWF